MSLGIELVTKVIVLATKLDQGSLISVQQQLRIIIMEVIHLRKPAQLIVPVMYRQINENKADFLFKIQVLDFSKVRAWVGLFHYDYRIFFSGYVQLIKIVLIFQTIDHCIWQLSPLSVLSTQSS